MKRNTMKTIVIILILVCLFIFLIPQNSYAGSEGPSFSIGNIMNSVKEFLSKGGEADDIGAAKEMAGEIQPLINTLYWVGVAIVIGAAMFLGIQYFKATGDPKEKAAIQGKLIGFSVSAVVLLAAYPIWSFLIELITGLA